MPPEKIQEFIDNISGRSLEELKAVRGQLEALNDENISDDIKRLIKLMNALINDENKANHIATEEDLDKLVDIILRDEIGIVAFSSLKMFKHIIVKCLLNPNDIAKVAVYFSENIYDLLDFTFEEIGDRETKPGINEVTRLNRALKGATGIKNAWPATKAILGEDFSGKPSSFILAVTNYINNNYQIKIKRSGPRR